MGREEEWREGGSKAKKEEVDDKQKEGQLEMEGWEDEKRDREGG